MVAPGNTADGDPRAFGFGPITDHRRVERDQRCNNE